MKTLFFISIGTRPIGKILRVIANYLGDQGSIPGRVILKKRMVHDNNAEYQAKN